MKSMQLLLGLCALLAAPAAAGTVEANPLGKVLELMTSLESKITAEGEAEEKAYKEYVEWCDDAATNKGFEIKTQQAAKAKLEAAIGKETGDIDAGVSKVEELAASIATSESELRDATAVREKEVADFKASEAELADAVDTIGRAVALIEREMAKNPASFAQVDTSSMRNIVNALSAIVDAAAFSGKDRQKLIALAQQGGQDDDADFGAPAAAVYKSHGSGILDVLEDLKEKAEEELDDLRKAEVSAKHNYEVTKQSLEDQTAADGKDLADEKASKASAEEAKARAEGDLTVCIEALKDAETGLESAKTSCMQVASDHDATVASRAEELKAIAEAIKILKDSSSGAVGQTYSLIQQNQQVRSSLRSRADLARAEVVTLVRKLAKEQHSAALAQLASRIAAVLRLGGGGAAQDPYAKVKGLISDMISKLESQRDSEATEKAYCDEQTAKTEAKKGELESDISRLSAKIDKAAAASAGLKEDVQRIQAELAALARAQAQMDKLRVESHADYATAKAELEQGLTGVRQALGVLRSYYGSGAAAAMLQDGQSLGEAMQQPALPESHSKATGAGSNIIGILEVVESDFAKNLAAEETLEADAASEHEKTTQENAVTRAMKEQDVKYSTQEYKALDKGGAEMTADRETSDTELSAVLDYYAKIKDRCIAKAGTYEERKKRRQAEIAGLKEALTILEDETALVQRGTRGRRPGQHFLGL